MPKINKVKWAKIWVDGKEYHQAIIVADKTWERDRTKLDSLFGTTHRLGDWEQQLLLSENPEVILIANGWSGFLQVSGDFKKKVAEAGAELRIVLTGKARKEYQRLVDEGKRVNALIHTTC